MVRSTTPAKDFMEACGWSFGPWRSDRLLNRRPRLSDFERRANRLATLAWNAVKNRIYYAKNCTKVRAYQRVYQAAARARLRAEREAHHGA
jgi:hypothetical protein